MNLFRGKWAAAAPLLLASVCAAQTTIPRVMDAPVPALSGAAAPAALSAPTLYPALSAPFSLSPAAAASLAIAPIPVQAFAAPAAAQAAPAAAQASPAAANAATPVAATPAAAKAASVPVVPASQSEERSDESPEESRARIERFWENTPPLPNGPDEVKSALDALVTGRASPEFIARVREHMTRTIPAPILREMVDAGYRIEINARIREGREDLDEDNDYTGGFHSYGPEGKFIVIAEFIKFKETGEWRPNKVWENGIDHEIGHAVAYIMGERAAKAAEAAGQTEQAEWYATKGISESPEFRAAWKADYDEIPDEFKQDKFADGKRNDFYYFLHPDENGWFQRARQETFAEGFDILLRGPRSSFNYANFRLFFPRSSEALRRILERQYGPIFGPRK